MIIFHSKGNHGLGRDKRSELGSLEEWDSVIHRLVVSQNRSQTQSDLQIGID